MDVPCSLFSETQLESLYSCWRRKEQFVDRTQMEASCQIKYPVPLPKYVFKDKYFLVLLV